MKNPLSKNRKQAGIYLSGNRHRPYHNTWKTFRSYQLKWDYRFQYYMARYYTNKGGK
jgi:hypothetical protein